MYALMFLAGLLSYHLLHSLAVWVVRQRATYDADDEAAMEQGIGCYRAKALEYARGGYGCLANSQWSDMQAMQRRLYRLRCTKALLRIPSTGKGGWTL